MSEVLTPTTRLEAVNSILASTGAPKCTSLDEPLRQDVINAESCLNEIGRMAQAQGWYWNREYEVPYTPDVDGLITLGDNVVSPRISNSGWNGTTQDYIFRGNRLYNRKDRTFVFAAGTSVLVDQTLLLEYTDLPEAARSYIWARAGMVYQARFLTSSLLFTFTNQMAAVAWAQMIADELEHERYNIVNSGALRDLVYRR